MSQENKNTATEVAQNEIKVDASYYEAIQTLAHYLNFLDGKLKGHILTIIDSIGLPEKQEKAIKDLIKEAVNNDLSFFGHQVNEDYLLNLAKYGALPISKDDEYSLKFSSLKNYKNWLPREERVD